MKRKRKHNLAVIIILAIISVLLSLRLIFYFFNEYRSSLWDKKSNFGVVVLGKDYMFVEINNSTQKIYVIKIPKNIKIQSREFGNSYTLEGIVNLGQIDHKTQDYFKEAISSFFAVPVDSFYKNPILDFKNFDFKFSDFIQKNTDLTVFDYFAIKKTGYKIHKIDLDKEIKFEKHYFNGEKQIFFDSDDIDRNFSVLFQDDYLNKQKLIFKIIASLKSESVVELYERLVTNLGFKLADLEFEEKNDLKKNTCFFKNQKRTPVVISNIFHCDTKIDESISYDVVLRLAD